MNVMLRILPASAVLAAGTVSLFLFGRKKHQPPPPERFRSLLFADQALDDFLSNPSTRSARHGAWEILKSARVLISGGKLEQAKAELRKAIEQPDVPTRIKLWAWGALRSLGEQPEAAAAEEVQGLVVEIPTEDLVDTVAVYTGGAVHFVDRAGRIAVSDKADGAVAGLSTSMLEFIKPAIGSLIQTSDHPQPGTEKVFFTALTFAGARYGTAPIEELKNGKHPFSPLYVISLELMKAMAELA